MFYIFPGFSDQLIGNRGGSLKIEKRIRLRHEEEDEKRLEKYEPRTMRDASSWWYRLASKRA